MKTYRVYIHERLVHSIEIEADSRSEAIDKAYELLSNATEEELNNHDYSNEAEYLGVEEVLEEVEIGEK